MVLTGIHENDLEQVMAKRRWQIKSSQSVFLSQNLGGIELRQDSSRAGRGTSSHTTPKQLAHVTHGSHLTAAVNPRHSIIQVKPIPRNFGRK